MRGIIKNFIGVGEHSPGTEGPRVIAVTSGKGGVGKTNITVNLAIALSSVGKRVVIFDADLGLANAEVLLGLNPRYTLYDFLYRNKSLEEILSPGPGSIQIISGGSGMLELANLSTEGIKRLRDSIKNFESSVDVVLVDTGAGLNKNVLAFVGAAQEVIVVVTPEPTSLTDAYSMIKVLASYNVHREINIIVNRIEKKREADETFYKLQVTAQHFLPNVNIKYLGAVPDDSRVLTAVKEQQPFMLHQPDCPASRAVKAVVSQLLGEGTKNAGGFSAFFNRLSRLFS
ncbi:MAG: MinD/ParA family protein [Desulfotomaculum sp.]|nr:MinD/ParA family protein [Desulfotomaculum sp.]